MNILVTGGNGFIGSHFIEFVLENTTEFNIINVDALTYAAHTHDIPEEFSSRYRFFHANIADQNIPIMLHTMKPDFIINFAAQTHVDNSIADPFTFVKTNVLETYNFICAVQEYYNTNPGIKFLHVSTDEVYGSLSIIDSPFTEQSPYAPNSPYSATKASADHLIRSFHKTYGLPAIIAHPCNNYGPLQHVEKFIPKVITNAHNNQPIPLYGSGMNMREWLYVKDTCEALFLLLLNGTVGEHYNIGSENTNYTNLLIASSILGLMNKPLDLIERVADRKGHDFRYQVDYSKLTGELGWKPKTSLHDGLIDTIAYYTRNR
jgi:dTDP-glucose 4,6-dehydratase